MVCLRLDVKETIDLRREALFEDLMGCSVDNGAENLNSLLSSDSYS